MTRTRSFVNVARDMGRESIATRERILGAAFVRFARYGFRRTSMEDIAGEAGVSRAALYLQFRNKEEIFKSLAQDLQDRALAAFTESRPEGWSHGWTCGSTQLRLDETVDEAIARADTDLLTRKRGRLPDQRT